MVRKCVYVSIKKVRKDAEHTAMRGHPGEEGRLEGRELYFICAAFFIKSVYYFYNPIFYLKKKILQGSAQAPSPGISRPPALTDALSFLLILAKQRGDGQAQSLPELPDAMCYPDIKRIMNFFLFGSQNTMAMSPWC